MENWKDIQGFEGLYQVSDHGRIKSVKRFGTPGGMIKINKDKCGYGIITLSKNGKLHTKKVHRLVAIHFIDNKNNLPEVNHLDAVKMNNNCKNLEWVDRAGNISHSVKNNLRVSGTKAWKSKFTVFDVESIRKSKEKIKVLSDIYSVSQSVISNVRNYKTYK